MLANLLAATLDGTIEDRAAAIAWLADNYGDIHNQQIN